MSHNAQQSKVSASRLQRGASGERKTTEALARLHSARSFNHSHCFTAEGWGSSLTPLGLRSFNDKRCAKVNGDGRLFGKRAVVLTVAHLWKHDCQHYSAGVRCAIESHVKAMCEGCHLRYDREQHANTRKVNREPRRLARQDCLFDFESK